MLYFIPTYSDSGPFYTMCKQICKPKQCALTTIKLLHHHNCTKGHLALYCNVVVTFKNLVQLKCKQHQSLQNKYHRDAIIKLGSFCLLSQPIVV